MMKPVQYHHEEFPPSGIDWNRLVPHMNKAHRALGSYNALLSAIPNPHVLLSPLITREAVLSSKIEGTNVTVSDVLQYEVGKLLENEEKIKDADEVVNYREALMIASNNVIETGMHQTLLRQTHSELLKGVRGKDKKPGEYREIQNWIGTLGCTQETAKFVPISPALLLSGMNDWMKFYQSNYQCELVQLALTHVEFEALHPFEDGNGRLGRILIPLFLFEKGLIDSPNFYMSGYLEKHDNEYKERLNDVSASGAWTEWCEFFLKGVANQADDNRKKVEAILELQKNLREKMKSVTRSVNSADIADFLISFPVFNSQRMKHSGKQSNTNAFKIIKKINDGGIVRKYTDSSGNKGSIYVFEPMLNIIG